MKKGIVMDVNDEYVTMLTPDGEFVKGRHTKEYYKIGEEMTFFPINERVRRTSKQYFFQLKKWHYAIASSLVVILILSLFNPLSSRNEVYAYMSIDINPSFEVGLDEKLRVISLEALNEEANKLLESIPDWKKSNLDSITEKIIQHSKENGYLKDGKQVLITTVVADTHDTVVDRELQKGIDEIKKEYEKDDIAVTTITSTVETRKSAKEKGISTGKLLIRENKVPQLVEEQKVEPAEIKKENKQDNAQKNDIHEFRKNGKQRAEKVQKELKEKKVRIKEKVKSNLENSNMPKHIKEKKVEKVEEKWEKEKRKQEEKEWKRGKKERKKEQKKEWKNEEKRERKIEEKRHKKENKRDNEND